MPISVCVCVWFSWEGRIAGENDVFVWSEEKGKAEREPASGCPNVCLPL